MLTASIIHKSGLHFWFEPLAYQIRVQTCLTHISLIWVASFGVSTETCWIFWCLFCVAVDKGVLFLNDFKGFDKFVNLVADLLMMFIISLLPFSAYFSHFLSLLTDAIYSQVSANYLASYSVIWLVWFMKNIVGSYFELVIVSNFFQLSFTGVVYSFILIINSMLERTHVSNHVWRSVQERLVIVRMNFVFMIWQFQFDVFKGHTHSNRLFAENLVTNSSLLAR